MFLFFKQKTAYELRISDWSSDVCSSDLPLLHSFHEIMAQGGKVVIDAAAVDRLSTPCVQILVSAVQHMEQHGIPFVIRSPSDAFVTAFDDLGLFSYLMQWPDRKSVVLGKSVSVSVDLGGRRLVKKKQT